MPERFACTTKMSAIRYKYTYFYMFHFPSEVSVTRYSPKPSCVANLNLLVSAVAEICRSHKNVAMRLQEVRKRLSVTVSRY